MQPYPTFYPQMNNNYQTPMQNPYMDRMAQLQQYQQSLQQPLTPTQMSGATVGFQYRSGCQIKMENLQMFLSLAKAW